MKGLMEAALKSLNLRRILFYSTKRIGLSLQPPLPLSRFLSLYIMLCRPLFYRGLQQLRAITLLTISKYIDCWSALCRRMPIIDPHNRQNCDRPVRLFLEMFWISFSRMMLNSRYSGVARG